MHWNCFGWKPPEGIIRTTLTEMIKVPMRKQICDKQIATTRLIWRQYVSRRAFFSRGFLLKDKKQLVCKCKHGVSLLHIWNLGK